MSHRRTGVLLTQLGTPKAATKAAVRPFLREFLSDPRVIDIPGLARAALVNLVIVPFRTPKSTKIYEELWEVGGGLSPILMHTEALTQALNERLKEDHVTVHMAMRYQVPSMDDVLEQMRLQNYDKIIILPMFPHYASSSTGTAIQKAMEIIAKWWVIPEIEVVNQFYDEAFYIDTLVEQARKHDLSTYDHIVISYHGLPDRHVDKVYDGPDNLCNDHHCDERLDSDNKFCYKATAYETSRLIAEKLNLEPSDYTTAFQSRLDDKWLTPFSDEVIEALAKKGMKRVLVFSPAFVADCLETLIEVGSEYQEIFEEHGGEHVQLVESCNTETTWVEGLTDFIRQRRVRQA
ncbi:MAG: ferrochelatase [Myxococcota bacterium]|nr:ferrochelatase [Myxococcota bacterium]